jgi:hypothetical protein
MLPFELSLGMFPRHSLTLSSASNFSRSASGLSDLNATWKWRFRNVDTTALNTSRTALLSGLQIPSGSGLWSANSFNPFVGLAHTSVVDRWGWGMSSEYKLNTGAGAEKNVTGMDARGYGLNIMSSLVWRASPAKYQESTKGAWYLSAEGGWVIASGSSSIRVGPSIFYEAKTWVYELGWQLYPLNTGSMLNFKGMLSTGVRVFF